MYGAYIPKIDPNTSRDTVITEDDVDDLLYPRTIGIMMKLYRMREKKEKKKRNEEVRKNGHISPMDILVEVATQDICKY